MCGESLTRVIVNGEGTEFTNPARSMVSWSEGFLVDVDGWSGILRGGSRFWKVGMTQRDGVHHDRGTE